MWWTKLSANRLRAGDLRRFCDARRYVMAKERDPVSRRGGLIVVLPWFLFPLGHRRESWFPKLITSGRMFFFVAYVEHLRQRRHVVKTFAKLIGIIMLNSCCSVFMESWRA